jgi:hypothetical protein
VSTNFVRLFVEKNAFCVIVLFIDTQQNTDYDIMISGNRAVFSCCFFDEKCVSVQIVVSLVDS